MSEHEECKHLRGTTCRKMRSVGLERDQLCVYENETPVTQCLYRRCYVYQRAGKEAAEKRVAVMTRTAEEMAQDLIELGQVHGQVECDAIDEMVSNDALRKRTLAAEKDANDLAKEVERQRAMCEVKVQRRRPAESFTCADCGGCNLLRLLRAHQKRKGKE